MHNAAKADRTDVSNTSRRLCLELDTGFVVGGESDVSDISGGTRDDGILFGDSAKHRKNEAKSDATISGISRNVIPFVTDKIVVRSFLIKNDDLAIGFLDMLVDDYD